MSEQTQQKTPGVDPLVAPLVDVLDAILRDIDRKKARLEWEQHALKAEMEAVVRTQLALAAKGCYRLN